MDIKISFVIPAHNEEAYIGHCIESILQETKERQDVEIIVVNNASTDRTKEVVGRYQHVKIVDEPNKGITKAREAGFRAAHGDLIANIDSDERLPEGWLEKVFEEFRKDEHLVCVSGPHLYPELGKAARLAVNVYYRVEYFIHSITVFFRVGAIVQGGNFVAKREALEKIGGFDTTIDFYGEDTDIAKRLSKIGKVKFSFSLAADSSARRFKGEGLIKTGLRYAANYFWVLFFKKPFSKTSKDFRYQK